MAEQLLRSELFNQFGITAVFTQRTGGFSPPPFGSFNFGSGLGDAEANIDSNLNHLVKIAGLNSLPHQVIQVHGSESYRCSGPGQMHRHEADILISQQPGTALAVRTADCLPILLADPQNGIIAAVHAGWRGTAARVVCRAVDEMIKLGVTAENIIASLGPCIGPCCFKIGRDTADLLASSSAGAESCISDGIEPNADIQAINRLQLLQRGLNEQRIETFSACTACDSEHYYSYRRDGKSSGRHLGVVALPSTP
ncbi:peptidoglycan editing factor PgeF [Mariprofundus sp. NF]|uniref:peptidoglycan editing factor PgeF n=1 Tax=Mariprofundus sp. NF TaxID=2608716 RepID=UPI0015A2BB6A|nr:peptidoglycan editing factor PgeF [Mariprofundus sp. NF]NWF38731.1 peptidoglycan editing factor PgeF [Mariprofundus sp. NF]